MAKLLPKTSACLISLFMAMIINQTSLARTLGNSTPSDHHHQNLHHHKITFLMRDIFNVKLTKPSTTKLTSTTAHKLPFSKPLGGLFPPKGAVLLPDTDINPATTASSSSPTLDLPGIGLSFPAAKATLQELELGTVTSIEEDIFHPLGYETYGSQLLGKAQGMHVASSEDGSSHMMALTVKFANNKGDDKVANGLRFFGVKRSDVNESHIAVIGGIGKYQGANGYATVKVMNVIRPSSVLGKDKLGAGKLLKFSVYLS
ncbi:hypothetical protein L484_000253 [Morus notabilis]|uniref:Dirigent protein n=1 Tax=Morus notabilis TaxID=981085 RepID=W9SFE3_9ROSA|nr:dirigent protein 24 [Morus notabilis]EXC73399.1 hypothetical protein L484_000253 [Morus notabilis]